MFLAELEMITYFIRKYYFRCIVALKKHIIKLPKSCTYIA
jgi:hypothetical protein